MSTWYEIKDQSDVEISEDGKTIEIEFDADYSGNYYIEVPIKFIPELAALRAENARLREALKNITDGAISVEITEESVGMYAVSEIDHRYLAKAREALKGGE